MDQCRNLYTPPNLFIIAEYLEADYARRIQRTSTAPPPHTHTHRFSATIYSTLRSSYRDVKKNCFFFQSQSYIIYIHVVLGFIEGHVSYAAATGLRYNCWKSHSPERDMTTNEREVE